MSADYFTAAIPEPHTILGLRLRPFSAGHIMLLNRIGNAFASEGELPDSDDLFTAVWLCSRDHADGLYCLNHAAEWAEKMGQWIATYCGTRTNRKVLIDFPAKCAAFANYLSLGSSTPSFRPIERGASISFTLELSLVQGIKIALLQNHIVQSESEFLDRPWGLSKWDYYALKGLKGDCEIFDAKAIEAAQEFANNVFLKMNRKQKRTKLKGTNGR